MKKESGYSFVCKSKSGKKTADDKTAELITELVKAAQFHGEKETRIKIVQLTKHLGLLDSYEITESEHLGHVVFEITKKSS